MPELSDDFRQDLAEVCWKDLRIHMQRDAIIIVAEDLDLVTTAIAVAEDDQGKVAKWVAGGKLLKPTADQVAAWETQLEKAFLMLIVQPFILVQAVDNA